MRIKKIMLRTTKPDKTKDDANLKNRLERAGFIKSYDKFSFYTPLGTMLRDSIEQYVIDFLENKNFTEANISKAKTVANMFENIGVVNNVLITSYKELPAKLIFRENLEFNLESSENLWDRENQKVLGFSSVGLKEEKIETLLENCLVSILKDTVSYEKGIYFPIISGEDTYKVDTFLVDEAKNKDTFKAKSPIKVDTPNQKTVNELCQYLSIMPKDILKTMIYTDGKKDYAVIIPGSKEVDLGKLTRVLGLEKGRMKAKSEQSIREELNISPGYIGPMGLNVEHTLIDYNVNKEKAYVSGANEENCHVQGVLYGRDYKGEFYDLEKNSNEEKGWLVGEARENLPMIRVQNAHSSQEYVPLQAAYINIDRLVLALCHQTMDGKGFNLSPNLNWFQGVVTVVDPRDQEAVRVSEEVYSRLTKAGFNIILDNRKDRLGSKYNDYDLISIPFRIILGKEYRDGFEFKNREGNICKVDLKNVVSIFEKAVIELKKESHQDMEEKNEAL